MEKAVKIVFDGYPAAVRRKLMHIRKIILDVAANENLGEVTETLKWGEPSYLARNGSTLRIDWKPRNPQWLSMYFNCRTTLVETFRQLFGDVLDYSGNREVRLPLDEDLPIAELQTCIYMTLNYHKLKRLPLLGG